MNLSLSKRTYFLFPQVLKLIGPQLENEERASEEEKSSILTCRLVCKSWKQSVDHYIDASLKPDFFQAPRSQRRDAALITARYKYFGFMAPQRLEQFLTYFGQSHQPHSGTQWNPFIGTTVAICTDSIYPDINRLFLRQPNCDNIVTLFRKYGQYIRVVSLGVLPSTGDEFRHYLWLKKCLQLVPNLTHLKVIQQPINQFINAISVDTDFGEHAYRTVPFEEYLRRRIFNEMAALPTEVLQQIYANMMEILSYMRRRNPADEGELYSPDELFFHLALKQGLAAGLQVNHEQQDENPDLYLKTDEYWTAIAGNLLPELKHLECLKLCRLSARVFNPLIQSNRQITWLHIEPLGFYKGMPECMDWWSLDFPNLRKLYIELVRGPEEVRRMRHLHPSFLKLTSLHFNYHMGTEYMGWIEILQILEQNWSSTLTELKIKFPRPRSEFDKENVRFACEHVTLALPKLKRLVVWKTNPWDDENAYRNFQFWKDIRDNLEEFLVVF